jgi:hypothetical protein
MTIPAVGPLPEPEERAQIISKYDNETLEKLRQHGLGRMISPSQPGKTAPLEKQEWRIFVGEIEAEQRKRLGR